MPHNLTVIGGADCSFCPQKAEVIVIGNNIQKIDNYAFKGAYIRKNGSLAKYSNNREKYL